LTLFIPGVKDLADFLPATLATILSYLSAEVTRGIWKPAFMNGTDWPSPAANLSIVEQQIKKILAATGVDVPSLAVGNSLYSLDNGLSLLVVEYVLFNKRKISIHSASTAKIKCPILSDFSAKVGTLHSEPNYISYILYIYWIIWKTLHRQ
jgi:hypothetical protein